MYILCYSTNWHSKLLLVINAPLKQNQLKCFVLNFVVHRVHFTELQKHCGISSGGKVRAQILWPHHTTWWGFPYLSLFSFRTTNECECEYWVKVVIEPILSKCCLFQPFQPPIKVQNSRAAYTLPVSPTEWGRQSTEKIPRLSSSVFEMRCDQCARRVQFGMNTWGKSSHTVSWYALRDQKPLLALFHISNRKSFHKVGSIHNIPSVSVTSAKAKFSWLA